MNRKMCFDFIESRLSILVYEIKRRGRLNLLDMNIHSEYFFRDFLNLLYGYDFKNMNTISQNCEGIDLFDETNHILAQVSSTCTRTKISSSLKSNIYSRYPNYRFVFISVSLDARSLKAAKYDSPEGIVFNPDTDIIDLDTIMRKILNLPTTELKNLYEFIKNELGNDVSYQKIESNLATVLNILSSEVMKIEVASPEINSFAIQDKIDFNELTGVQEIIDDYKIYYHRIDEIYNEFDREGKIKRYSVLQSIKTQYIKARNEKNDATDIFLLTIEKVMNIISASSNFVTIPIDELQVCAGILVVDAFIRCKIFYNPEGYNHADA